jgi:membrane-associated phospholipid phosphatase
LTAAKFLGSGLGTVVVGLIIACLDPLRWRRAASLWLMVAVCGLGAGVVKIATGRERPSHLEQPAGRERLAFHGPRRGVEAPFQSFPSGHTVTSFASATCLAAFYPPARVVFYSIASATAVNRVVEHQHFLSDVIAGALMGHLLTLWLLHRKPVSRWWCSVDRKQGAA